MHPHWRAAGEACRPTDETCWEAVRLFWGMRVGHRDSPSHAEVQQEVPPSVADASPQLRALEYQGQASACLWLGLFLEDLRDASASKQKREMTALVLCLP